MKPKQSKTMYGQHHHHLYACRLYGHSSKSRTQPLHIHFFTYTTSALSAWKDNTALLVTLSTVDSTPSGSEPSPALLKALQDMLAAQSQNQQQPLHALQPALRREHVDPTAFRRRVSGTGTGFSNYVIIIVEGNLWRGCFECISHIVLRA